MRFVLELRVNRGSGVLLPLLLSLSVCTVISQTRLFHQSSCLYCLCHCSLFHSVSPFAHLSLYSSPSPSLPALSIRTSNSMVKYPGQCVALQRDSGSTFAGNEPESKWAVVFAEHYGCTSYGPQSNHIKGAPHGPKPSHKAVEIWTLSPTSPSLKNPLIPRRDHFYFTS